MEPTPLDDGETQRRRRGDLIAERFEIVCGLGSGGNATVWKVIDRDGKEYALKILDDHDPHSEPFQRFAFEVAVHAQIPPATPGIVPILAAYLPEAPQFDDPAWALMPVALPLPQYLERRQSLADIVSIFAAFAATLRELHAREIKHRDIKPGNLFIYQEHPCLGDFGLASFPEKTPITTNARQVGARNFTAAEMIRDPKNSDAKKADVYSLALTLWVAAVNQKWPLPGEYDPDRKPYRIGEYLTDPAEAARSRSLDVLIARSTNVDPDLRPTMAEVAAELAAWLLPAPPPSDSMDVDDLVAEFEPVISTEERKRREQKWIQQQRTRIRTRFEQAIRPFVEPIGRVTGGNAGMGENYVIAQTFVSLDPSRPRIDALGQVTHPVQGSIGDCHISLGLHASFARETAVYSAVAVVRGKNYTGGLDDFIVSESEHRTVPIESAQEERAIIELSQWLRDRARPTIKSALEVLRRTI